MTLTIADRVWNRAALESGGTQPRPGDLALAAALRFHGLVMNGGVHHALECVTPEEQSSAAAGFGYFGLQELQEFLSQPAKHPLLSRWTAKTERAANRRYAELLPSDSALDRHFQRVFAARPDQFAPLDP